MSCRSRASRLEFITALKKKHDYETLSILRQDGDVLLVCRKGFNPEGERNPMLKCPVCWKNLHRVWKPYIKNDTILFNRDDPRYADLPFETQMRCSKCHHVIGELIMDSGSRKLLGLPQAYECHRKLTIEEVSEKLRQYIKENNTAKPIVLPSVYMGC